VTTNADSTPPPIRPRHQAIVSINGEATLTDDTGLFQLEYNQSCAPPLVQFNIPAYDPLTRVFQNDEFQGQLISPKAQLTWTKLSRPDFGISWTSSTATSFHIPAGSLATAMERPSNPA